MVPSACFAAAVALPTWLIVAFGATQLCWRIQGMDCFSNRSTPGNAPPCRYTWMHPCTTAAAMDLGRRAAGIVAAGHGLQLLTRLQHLGQTSDTRVQITASSGASCQHTPPIRQAREGPGEWAWKVKGASESPAWGGQREGTVKVELRRVTGGGRVMRPTLQARGALGEGADS